MTKRGDATKQRILDAAVSLFAEGGFRAVRIAQICERAGVSPTSVYWHFENKSVLIQAVLESAFKPIGEEMIAGSGGASDIDAFIKSLEKLVVTQPAGALTMLAYVADNIKDPELERGITATRKDELKLQTRLLTESLNTGPESAKALGILINACVNYAGLVHLSGGSRKEVREVIQTIKHFF
ncbi:MAG: TetR/AcrR family transcriptional regulator [Pseudomonadota bacterium]